MFHFGLSSFCLRRHFSAQSLQPCKTFAHAYQDRKVSCILFLPQGIASVLRRTQLVAYTTKDFSQSLEGGDF